MTTPSKGASLAFAAVFLAVIISGGLYWQRKMVRALPPITACESLQDAYRRALTAAGGDVRLISAVMGTGSMAPAIPAAPAGMDPYHTVVAYVVFRSGAKFADVQQGDLCLYKADWTPPDAMLTLHQAAQQDSAGWIMSGLANSHYESNTRMTVGNFRGIAAAVFIWPLP